MDPDQELFKQNSSASGQEDSPLSPGPRELSSTKTLITNPINPLPIEETQVPPKKTVAAQAPKSTLLATHLNAGSEMDSMVQPNHKNPFRDQYTPDTAGDDDAEFTYV